MIGIELFAEFMRNNSSVIDPQRTDHIYDPMDQPLTDYWIASR